MRISSAVLVSDADGKMVMLLLSLVAGG